MIEGAQLLGNETGTAGSTRRAGCRDNTTNAGRPEAHQRDRCSRRVAEACRDLGVSVEKDDKGRSGALAPSKRGSLPKTLGGAAVWGRRQSAAERTARSFTLGVACVKMALLSLSREYVVVGFGVAGESRQRAV